MVSSQPGLSHRPFAAVQRAAADSREDLLSAEVAELQRRCGEAEVRQQEAAARLPEATAPLLRQIEAMQVRSRAFSTFFGWFGIFDKESWI